MVFSTLRPEDVPASIRAGDIVLAVVGLGHVGLPLAVLLASEGAKVIGCEREGEYLAKLKRGGSPIVEHSARSFAAQVLETTCPNCGVRLLKEKGEVFCPNCMKVVEMEGDRSRLTGADHRQSGRPQADNEVESLLVDSLRTGRLSLTTDVRDAVSRSDVVIVCVGTPIDDKKRPDLTALIAASKGIGKGLRKGTLVILKSTVSPGTTEDIFAPILERESGLKRGEDFSLAHVPETTLEGLALFGHRTLPKTIGGIDKRSSELAAAVFKVFDVPVYIFDGPKVTEAAKLFQNIYRDVNIALANEFALASESLGLDVTKVIDAALTEPKTHILTPGPGVGGYCLTKDAYYLTTPASKKGFRPRILFTARSVNDSMPTHVVRLLVEALTEAGITADGANVAVLGVSFKANTADVRDSPSLKVIEKLLRKGVKLSIHDPLADLNSIPILRRAELSSKNLGQVLERAVALLLLTNHLEYRSLSQVSLAKMAPSLRVVVDSRHVFDPSKILTMGYVYRGVGRRLPMQRARGR